MKRIAVLIASTIAVAAPVVAASTAGAAGSAASLPTLKLTLTGKSVAVSGARVSGAVNVTSRVTGASAAPILVRLNPGASFKRAFRAVAAHHGDPNYLAPYGAIVFGAGNATHGTSTVQTVLTPGNYVAIDTTNDNPAKWPHTAFKVKKAASPKSLPKPAATVKAIEFGFTGASTLRRGSLVRFENTGFLVHMIVAVRVKDAAAAQQLTSLLLAGKDAEAQKLGLGFESFLQPVSSGAAQQEIVTAQPGTYVLACFMSTQDGREHTTLGMERTITVK